MVNSELDIKSFYPDVTTHDPFIKFTLKNTSVNDKIAKSFEIETLAFALKTSALNLKSLLIYPKYIHSTI